MSFPAYKDYRNSGIEWLGKVPSHWKLRKIKHIANVVGGGTPNREKLEYWNGDIPWVSPKDMKLETISSAEERITDLGLKNSSTSYQREGRVLMVIRSGILQHTLPVAINIVPVALNQDMKAFSFDKETCIPQFFRRWVQGLNDILLIAWANQGATVESISQPLLENTTIPLPPLAEQQAISSFLDVETSKSDALVSEQRRLIELLKEKRQAVISHAVTKGLNPNAPMKPSGIQWLGDVPEHWEVTRVGFLTSKVGSGKTPSGGADNYKGEGVLFIRSQNVYDEGLRLDDAVYITEKTDSEMAVSRVCSGDILLNITGASLGRTCLVPDDVPPANVNQHVCIIRLPNADLREFVSLILKSLSMKNQFDYAQNGAAREGLNFEQISRLRLALPKTDNERNKIVAYANRQAEKFTKLIAEAKRAIELLQERRTALISAAVTGKIDVREFGSTEAAQ